MLVIILAVIGILLIAYVILLRQQIRSINRQLTRRMEEKTRQPVSLELLNKELNKLAANINKCLKSEETLRLESVREEKHFKELIANISHDLRTPLTAIKGYQQLLEKAELSEEQQQKLQIAKKHTTQLGALIDHFFEYTYLVNAETELVMERLNLTNLVTECIAEFITAFEEKNLTVYLAETPPILMIADKKMITRIVQNLIRNCLAHARGDIEVEILADKNAILLFRNPVEDASDIDVNRIFERFYTADRARGRTTGLGLSIVRLLAEQLGGNASASIQDGFFEIRVELPLLTSFNHQI